MDFADTARGTRRVTSALLWAAKHIGAGTGSLDLCIRAYEGTSRFGGDSMMIHAFARQAQLGHLRCLKSDLRTVIHKHPLLEVFLYWLVQHAPGLGAISLRQHRIHAANISHQHLRHLQVKGSAFPSASFHIAAQMPLLETLHIEGPGVGVVIDEINASRCEHLRLLVVRKASVQKLLSDSGCRVGISLRDIWYDLSVLWADPISSLLGSAHHLDPDPSDGELFASETTHGFFEMLPCMDVLTLSWLGNVHSRSYRAPEDFDALAAQLSLAPELLLTSLMPASGQPLWNLKVIVIETSTMRGCIPAKLPNLEKIVVMAHRLLQLTFEDPVATASALKKLYFFGQQGTAISHQMLGMLGNSIRHGLTLVTVSAAEAGEHARRGSSCTYLWSTTEHDVSINELYRMVSQLAGMCRCGACFQCLGL